MKKGKLLKGIGGFYYTYSDGKVYTLKAKKNMKHRGLKLLVGDNVHFTEVGLEGWIDDIIPRKNQLIRPSVANVDVLAIVIASEPKPDYIMLDILLITAFKQGIKPIIIHNKSDIGIDEGLNDYKNTGVDIYNVSSVTGYGVGTLRQALHCNTVCFAGQSGVGKSTLTNMLIGTNIETGTISQKIKRGKHTTRHAEIHLGNDIMLFDTPGFSSMELMKEVEPEEIQHYYPELQDAIANCYFKPCLHISEPNCAVKEKLNKGLINKGRMNRYEELVMIALQNRRNRYV